MKTNMSQISIVYMNIQIIIVLVGVSLGSSILFSNVVNADESSLPDWLKNTAKWWSEGSVEDSDFINGIQWLIDKKLIVISQDNELSNQKLWSMPFEFSMMYPPNWERQTAFINGYDLLTSALVESTSMDNIGFTYISVSIDELVGYTFEEYIDGFVEIYEEEFPEFKLVEDGMRSVAESEAYFLEFEYNEFLPMKSKTVYVEHENKVYIITFESKEKIYDEFLPEFEQILSTLEFL